MKLKYAKVETYQQAFEFVLGIKFDEKLQQCVKRLENEGYAEKNIAYAIWKTQDKLLAFLHDSRFCSILQNEVRKNAYTKEQWKEYWRLKKIEERGI